MIDLAQHAEEFIKSVISLRVAAGRAPVGTQVISSAIAHDNDVLAVVTTRAPYSRAEWYYAVWEIVYTVDSQVPDDLTGSYANTTVGEPFDEFSYTEEVALAVRAEKEK